MKRTILCVDDEQDNVDALERVFRKKYKVLKATSGAEGLALVKEHKPILIVSDQRMPNQTGVEFLTETMQYVPEAIRILLTGYTDIDSVIGAINSGQVYRYISKPWDPVDLANTVDKAVEKYELSAELAEKNRELTKAFEELRVLDEAKDKFMILINHELKTPLTVIISFCELLKETELDEEQRLFVKRIVQSSERLQRLVDDSMLFIAAETKTLKVSKKKIKIKDVFASLQEKYAEIAKEKNQTIKLDDNDTTVKADPKIIEDVLGRLIENALRHGKKESEVVVRVVTAGDSIALSVENEGKAISQKIIDTLNRPFNLDEDIMKHSEGLGLGLSITHALLRAHDSRLDISYTDGHVQVSFPVS